MSEHFIKEIEIKNFKCFENFKVEGFGRVNLIGGKNNVGKTAFMEALDLSLQATDTFALANSLYNLIWNRQTAISGERYFELDFIYKDSNKLELTINNKKIIIEYMDSVDDIDESSLYSKYEPALKLSVNEDIKTFSINRIIERPPIIRRTLDSKDVININFISSTTMYDKDIAVLYGSLVDLGKESFLDESLKLFDPNILALKQKAIKRGVVLKLLLKDREHPVLLSSLGEGVNRYIAILCAIWASKDGFLFIDEIENGIHYSNFDKLWNIILQTSKKANCQLFITSHSKECIESYARVAKKLEDKEIGFIELGQNKKNELDAVVMDSEMFQRFIKLGNEVRGW